MVRRGARTLRLPGLRAGWQPHGHGRAYNRGAFPRGAEWIDERRIPDEIYKECKISRAEWDAWMGRQG